MNNHSPLVAGTIAFVGVLFSAVLWFGTLQLKTFNENFRYKDFTSDSDGPTQAVRLNDKQFVVVSPEGARISVYSVDAKGKLIRTSDDDVRTFESLTRVRSSQ